MGLKLDYAFAWWHRGCLNSSIFFFKQKTAYEILACLEFRRVLFRSRDKMPPCNNACGTNEKIQGYLDLVKRGKYLDAYALIKEDMPFPSITGRVCYHPCEQACNRDRKSVV